MALYRTGTASMDAQGVITGTDTKWREPLSLIRTGATIVFLTTPLKLAVISDIVSDTEMKAIQTDGEPVANGNYVILLNDSLTVDGMAQDVAETLRYYQSKETVIEEAIEFLKNFDLKTLQDLVARAEASAQKTDADRAATEQLKNDTQTIKDAAVNETNQIKIDTDAIKNQTQQIKDSAVTEITVIKNEALDARDEAESAQLSAEQSKVGADNAKSGAETARDEARQWAQQVNPENILHKDQNLFDVPDKKTARLNINAPCATKIIPDKTNILDFFINNNESGIFSSGSDVLNSPPGGGWFVYNFSIHARNSEGTSPEFGMVTAISSTKRMFFIALENGSWPNGWFEVYRQNGDASYGSVTCKSGGFFGIGTTGSGGSRTIKLWNTEEQQNESFTSINGIRGDFYDSHWQVFGTRGTGADMERVTVHIGNPSQNDHKFFNFHRGLGGYIEASKGFKGFCSKGGWGYEGQNMGAVFHGDIINVGASSDLWSPVVSGGYIHEGGFKLNYALGAVGHGSNSWPAADIKLLGDDRYHRSFEFNVLGGISTWGNDPWGGSYEFAKNPTSDRDLKKDIKYTDGRDSYDRVMQWLPTMFKYKGSDIQRFGLIAQDLLKIDPQYVKLVPGSPVFEDVLGVDEEGNEYVDHQIEVDRNDDVLALDSNVMLTDMACAMVYMGNEMENLKNEVDELKRIVNSLLSK